MRLPSIDFLRGLAVILVLFSHHWVGLDKINHVGWVGVDLFFVISGFLVSGLLFAEHKKFGDVHKLRFLIRRGFKIYPLFFVSYVLTIIILLTVGFEGFDRLNAKGKALTIIGETVFLQNYLGALWPHHWSLAVEEHFYLLIVIVFPLLIKYFRFVPVVFGLVIGMRVLTVVFTSHDGMQNSHLRMDSLLMGVCIAYVYHFGDLKKFHDKFRWALIAAAFLPLLFIAEDPHASVLTKTAGLTAMYLAFGSLLILFLYNDFSRIPLFRPVAWIGFYSYGIYLFHMYLIKFVVGEPGNVFGVSLVARFLVYFFGSIALGALISYLIEKPFLRLRDRWYPRRAAAIAE